MDYFRIFSTDAIIALSNSIRLCFSKPGQLAFCFVFKRVSCCVLPVSQELDEINIKIADAAVRGQLDSSPFLQGILLQMMRKLDKDRRGVGMQGRPMSSTATEHQLISDAAFEFAMLGKNKELAMRLGQQLRPPALSTEDLPKHSLPNPTLALATQRAEILRANLQAIHRLFALSEGQQERRLIVSIDHTYLCRSLVQSKLAGQAGLIGSAWSPVVVKISAGCLSVP